MESGNGRKRPSLVWYCLRNAHPGAPNAGASWMHLGASRRGQTPLFGIRHIHSRIAASPIEAESRIREIQKRDFADLKTL
jgi:hypothetical protein